MKLRTGILLCAAAILVACESLSIYRPAKSAGDVGFSEQKLSENQYRVTFQGNAGTSRVRVEDYLLFRAAELTSEKGYDYFVVTEHDTEADKRYLIRYRADPYSLYDHYHGPIQFRFPYYAYGYEWGHPMEESVREVTRYAAISYIRMFKGDIPQGEDLAFNADEVMANVGPIDCWHEEPHDEAECKLAHPSK